MFIVAVPPVTNAEYSIWLEELANTNPFAAILSNVPEVWIIEKLSVSFVSVSPEPFVYICNRPAVPVSVELVKTKVACINVKGGAVKVAVSAVCVVIELSVTSIGGEPVNLK